MKRKIKKHELLKELSNELVVNYENEGLSIHFYKEILSISEDVISFKTLNVYGNDLVVTYIDKYVVSICGKIDKVERVCE